MKYLLHYIENKKLILIFTLITLQQSLNALGTYALAKAGLSFQNWQVFFVWIIASVLLFLLAPAVNIFIRRLESELSFSAYKIFLQESLFIKQGNTTLWQSKALKDHFLASIGSDASDYLGLMLFISMDIYSFVLSVVLGVLTLSFTVDMSLLPAFLISGLISFFVYRKFSSKVEKSYNCEQQARTNLGGHLLKSWDNVLLNNRQINDNYLGIFDERIGEAKSKAILSSTASEVLIFALGLVAGIPILVSIAWILWHSNPAVDTKVLIALLATLPRQLNILGLFRNIFQSLTSLLGVEAKFDSIRSGTQIPSRDLPASIKESLMTLNQTQVSNLEVITKLVSDSSNGRYEIRGPNGSGKSTLLLHMNHQLDSSVYLPTHPDLMFDKEPLAPRSSGENLLAHIEALGRSSEKIILLDEWDANLDEFNLRCVNAQIENLARTKVVVEVRHRG